MTTYLTIHCADRATEHCAVRTTRAAVREINHCLSLAGRGDLAIPEQPYGNRFVTDDFRDEIACRLGEDGNTGAESILPITTTDSPTGWDIAEHIDWVVWDAGRLTQIASIAAGLSSSGQVTVDRLDVLADEMMICIVEGGDHDNVIRTYLRLAGNRWRDALSAVLQPVAATT
jgi:hypothetical protein